MTQAFSRTALVLGDDALIKLQKSHVIVFGVGGVGGYVTEVLIRAGIGELSIVDNDFITESNINRQIIALHSTIGISKVDVVEKRALDINPNIIVHKYNLFFDKTNSNQFDFSKYDYIIDCIDTVTAKIEIIQKSIMANNKNIICCLGTGNKLDPMGFKVTTIEKTKVCPLAKVMRRELKQRGIKGIKCVYSEENPVSVTTKTVNDTNESRHTPGSVSFVPPAAGLLLASQVIHDLLDNDTSLA